MRLSLAQLNPTVGDIKGNVEKLKKTFLAESSRSDLVIFPEMFITGYPPRDLLEKPDFLKKVSSALEEVASFTEGKNGAGIITGAPVPCNEAGGPQLYNAALLIAGGEIIFTQGKTLLPSYDVFDEERYFRSSGIRQPAEFKGRKIGITVCEDMWPDPAGRERGQDPVAELADMGAELIINISASPFYAGKPAKRIELIRKHVSKHKIPFVFVNQAGGNDELIFDGSSLVFDSAGNCLTSFPSFTERVERVDLSERAGGCSPYSEGETASILGALVMGVRDYMAKCGFEKAVIGLSGGIDSAVTCALAARAVGPGNVTGVIMPSGYTDDESAALAKELALNLGVNIETVPIEGLYRYYLKELEPFIPEQGEVDITFQNIQARIRGNILMALSNRYGWLLLSTGNKSETAVGYTTLYGDLAGGLAVISDVPKTMVYRLAGYINSKEVLIPEGSITRPPSAELRPDQKDSDSLPPYEVLDGILHSYIELNRTFDEIVKEGYGPDTVRWVIGAVRRSEYKRRQSPPGLKVTSKAFGTGRRMPVASLY